MENLRFLLARSREHPLKIYLKIYNHPWQHVGERDRATAFMQLLFEHVHRWKTIHLEFSRPEFFPYFPEMDHWKADILQSLRITTSGVYSLPLSWIAILASSPKLRVWRECGGYSYSSALPLLESLRTLQLAVPVSTSEAFRILQSLPSLEHLSIQLDKESNSTRAILPVFSMLKSLDISLTAPSSLQVLFLGIHVPNLEHLGFHFLEFSSFDLHMNQVKNFLKKTSGQITSFSIRNMCITEDVLLELLTILSPYLKRFEILADSTLTSADYYAIENVGDKTIRALTPTSEEQPLCPRLEHITLERCLQAQDGVLSEMAESRYQSSSNVLSRLCCFQVVFRYHTHPIDTTRLRKLQAEGLRCLVQYGSLRARFEDFLH